VSKQPNPEVLLNAAFEEHGPGRAFELYGLAVLAARQQADTTDDLDKLLASAGIKNPQEKRQRAWTDLRRMRKRIQATGQDAGHPMAMLKQLARAGIQ
jgi:hypothetical protein